MTELLRGLCYALAWMGVAILGYDLFSKPLAWLGEQAGWAFYRRHKRAAERKTLRRELLRAELGIAMARYQQAQAEMAAQMHQHAHTLASLTGQPYIVTHDEIRGPSVVPVRVPEMILPVGQVRDDPRHYPWTAGVPCPSQHGLLDPRVHDRLHLDPP